jgi:hypothetical protein
MITRNKTGTVITGAYGRRRRTDQPTGHPHGIGRGGHERWAADLPVTLVSVCPSVSDGSNWAAHRRRPMTAGVTPAAMPGGFRGAAHRSAGQGQSAAGSSDRATVEMNVVVDHPFRVACARSAAGRTACAGSGAAGGQRPAARGDRRRGCERTGLEVILTDAARPKLSLVPRGPSPVCQVSRPPAVRRGHGIVKIAVKEEPHRRGLPDQPRPRTPFGHVPHGQGAQLAASQLEIVAVPRRREAGTCPAGRTRKRQADRRSAAPRPVARGRSAPALHPALGRSASAAGRSCPGRAAAPSWGSTWSTLPVDAT